jgi:parallel beta-helix repeat protein
MTRIRRAGAFLAVSIAATLPTIGGAGAAVLSCGQTITQSTTLTADVGPCAAGGVILGADGITLNLGGFRIFGSPSAGDGAGVLAQNRIGVVVTNGTVTDFDGGVVILGGSRNTVMGITARHNIGASAGHDGPSLTLYGDGILIQGSRSNSIVNNIADDNGPFSGIGVIRGDSDHPAVPPADAPFNTIRGNKVTNNVACRTGPFCDNDGIRIEPNVTDTQIIENQVVGNGLDGISLFGGTTRNLVRGNQVVNSGFQGAVPGDGIRVFGFGNTIENNTVYRSAAGGVSVARRPPTAGSFPATNPNGRGNTLRNNNASASGLFDLWDSNRSPDCDANVWSGNQGATASPSSCVRNP